MNKTVLKLYDYKLSYDSSSYVVTRRRPANNSSHCEYDSILVIFLQVQAIFQALVSSFFNQEYESLVTDIHFENLQIDVLIYKRKICFAMVTFSMPLD